MQKRVCCFTFFVTIFSFFLISCSSKDGEVKRVTNSSPKFTNKEYIRLEKLHSIDVTEIGFISGNGFLFFDNIISFDNYANIYILDQKECTISVFNKQGQYKTIFGGRGQGPKEFTRPHRIFISHNNIHIFYNIFEHKIFSTKGEYISNDLKQVKNCIKYKTVRNNLYCLRAIPSENFTKKTFLLEIHDEYFSKIKNLFKYPYPSHLDLKDNYHFHYANWMLITNTGEFYFPEDNFNKYSLIKYDKKGKPKLIFGRDYIVREYSDKAKKSFYSLYDPVIKSGEIKFSKSPPVVRKMFQDQKNNIWVISGETWKDSESPDFKNTIDIFSEDGKWLYSFKTNKILRNCIYHNGRIYQVGPENPDSFEQTIDVYEIKY